jgi:hypothetical protein
MPPAADDPPLDRVSAAPPAAPSADAAPVTTAGDPTPQGEASLGAESHRRRRRRRRHPPRDLASTVAGSDPGVSPDGDRSPGADAADPALGEGVSATSPPADASNAAGDHPPHRRRRRRRRPPPGNFGSRPAPGGLGSALSMADPAAAASADDADGLSEGTVDRETDATDAGAGGDSSRATLHLRLPIPRRRRLAQPPGLPRGSAEAVVPDGDTPAAEAAAGLPRREAEFPRRQRRRRPPRSGDGGPAGSGDGGPAGQGQRAEGTLRDANRPPRSRDRNRRPGEEQARDPQPQRAGEPQRHTPGRGPRDADSGGLGRGYGAAPRRAKTLRARSNGRSRF